MAAQRRLPPPGLSAAARTTVVPKRLRRSVLPAGGRERPSLLRRRRPRRARAARPARPRRELPAMAGDAHSWVEVYFPGTGFVRFDPTPASARGSTQEGLRARAILFWDGLQQRWRAFVVDYDLITQARAMRRLAQLVDETGRRLAGTGDAPAGRARVAAAALAVVLGGALATVLVRRRARLRKRGGELALTADQERALRLWRAARVLLRRAGIEVAPATTPRELARRVPVAGEVAVIHAEARWGVGTLPASTARAALRRLRTALRERVATDRAA